MSWGGEKKNRRQGTRGWRQGEGRSGNNPKQKTTNQTAEEAREVSRCQEYDKCGGMEGLFIKPGELNLGTTKKTRGEGKGQNNNTRRGLKLQSADKQRIGRRPEKRTKDRYATGNTTDGKTFRRAWTVKKKKTAKKNIQIQVGWEGGGRQRNQKGARWFPRRGRTRRLGSESGFSLLCVRKQISR